MYKKLFISIVLTLFAGCVQAKPKEKPRTYHVCTSNDAPEDILACSMFAEARGDGSRAMEMVGHVILNRKAQEQYPDKISKIVYQKNQFSYIKGKRMKIQDKDSWLLAKKIAKSLLSMGKEQRKACDVTKNAVFFIKKGRRAYWTKHKVKTVTYKSHVFYREKAR